MTLTIGWLKRLTLVWLTLAAVALSVGALPVRAAHDDTYVDAGYADDDGDAYFATLQAAIDATAAGGTVHVAAGAYHESVTIDKGLTLLGAQANVDPRPSQGGRSGAESIIDAKESASAVIVIAAGGVEINGFTITGGTGDMVEENGSAHNLLFHYNILYDDLDTAGDEGIQIKHSDGVVIAYNYAHDIVQDAFNLSCSSNGVIRYNEADNIHSINAAIYCYDATNIDIIGNLVYDVPNNDGIKLGDQDDGSTGGLVKDNVVRDVAQDGITIYASHATVQGNTIHNCRSENGALYLYGADDTLVLDNEIYDNAAIGLLIANASGVTVEGNAIRDNNDEDDTKYAGSAGVWVDSSASGVTLRNNAITDNKHFGLRNESSSDVDARLNWWGADGPGGSIAGGGPYSPWLDGEPPHGRPTSTDGKPVINLDTGDTFTTIQAAIDDSNTQSGHTISVAEGTYNQPLTLDDSNLTIRSTGAVSKTIIDGAGTSGAMITNTGSDNVITGLTIQNVDTAFSVSGGSLTAYANNVSNFNTGVDASGGTIDATHNWWGAVDPSNVGDADADAFRLGAPVVSYVDGTTSVGLYDATADGYTVFRGSGTLVLVNHGDSLRHAPFGKAVSPHAVEGCADAYDVFAIDGSGSYHVSMPITATCQSDPAVTTSAPRLLQFVLDDALAPDTTCSPDEDCWTERTATYDGTALTASGIGADSLLGTPFSAPVRKGAESTAVALTTFGASSANPVLPALVLTLSTMLGAIVWTRRR